MSVDVAIDARGIAGVVLNHPSVNALDPGCVLGRGRQRRPSASAPDSQEARDAHVEKRNARFERKSEG